MIIDKRRRTFRLLKDKQKEAYNCSSIAKIYECEGK